MKPFKSIAFVGVLAGLFVALLPSAGASETCTESGFFPPNKLNLSVHAMRDANITEAVFNQIIDKVDRVYRPVIAQAGGNLVIDRSWNDGTVNAYADRQGKNWIIKMFGGLARHPTITPDGFTLVVCHETGHHLGGAPKIPGTWASNEGEADYFANLKCLRNVWANENNVEIAKTLGVPAAVQRNCEMSFGDANAIAICERGAMAGLSSAKLMRELGGEPPIDFSTPDPHVVPGTYNEHPAAQCRLDTYYNGSICQVAASEPLSDADPRVGVCATETGATRGYRPLCWYKPNGPGPQPTPTPLPTPTPTPTPTTPPNPGGGIARPPLSAGQSTVVVTNPNARVEFAYDVSEFPGAAGVWFEFSAPNRPFVEPNGITPDPYRTIGAALRGPRSGFYVIPGRALPGWGTYQIRVIPLDSTGKRAVGRFSNPSMLIFQR
ncbi:MAG: hypothetical protein JST04_00480 [Bdellovibrionales bacterium]|nr:hypothetical protein [Bdellovibrionales bacterium]